MLIQLRKKTYRFLPFFLILAFNAIAMVAALHYHHHGESENDGLCIFCSFTPDMGQELITTIPLLLSGNCKADAFPILFLPFQLYNEHFLPYLNGPPRTS